MEWSRVKWGRVKEEVLQWVPAVGALASIVIAITSIWITSIIADRKAELERTNRTLAVQSTYLSLDAIQQLVILGQRASDSLLYEIKLNSQRGGTSKISNYSLARKVYNRITGENIDTIRTWANVLLDSTEFLHKCGWEFPGDHPSSCDKFLLASYFGGGILPAFFGLRHLYYCDDFVSDADMYRTWNLDENSQLYKLETIILSHLKSEFADDFPDQRVYRWRGDPKYLDDGRPEGVPIVRPDLSNYCAV